MDEIKGPDLPTLDSGEDITDQKSPEDVIDNPDIEDVLQLAHRYVLNLYSYRYSKFLKKCYIKMLPSHN